MILCGERNRLSGGIRPLQDYLSLPGNDFQGREIFENKIINYDKIKKDVR